MTRGKLISIFPKAAYNEKTDIVEAMLKKGVVSKGEAEIALRNSISSGNNAQVNTIVIVLIIAAVTLLPSIRIVTSCSLADLFVMTI